MPMEAEHGRKGTHPWAAAPMDRGRPAGGWGDAWKPQGEAVSLTTIRQGCLRPSVPVFV